jgi:hypothetical protein
MAKHTALPWELVKLDKPTDDWAGASFIIRAPRAAPGGIAAIIGGLGEEEEPTANLFLAAPFLLAACKAQHKAMDELMAKLIALDDTFLPSKSGEIWEAMLEGKRAIAKAETPGN